MAAEVSASPDDGRFTIRRTGPNTGIMRVEIRVSGTATNGTDYETIPTYVAMEAGQTSATVSVVPRTDAAQEGPETVVVSVVNGVGYEAGTASSASVTILDTPAGIVLPVVTLTVDDAAASEIALAPDTAKVTVRRTGDLAAALTVNLLIAGTATNGTDYITLPAEVTIPAGQFATTLNLIARMDAVTEGQETVTLTLLRGLYMAGSSAYAPLYINDALPGQQPFAVGTTYIGTMPTAGESITITPAAGELVFVSLGRVNGGAPRLRVQELGSLSPYFTSANSIGTELVSSGVPMSISVSGSNSYRLTVVKIPGPTGVATGDEGGSIVPGVAYSGSIVPGDLDVWTFTAQQGAHVVLTATSTSGATASFAPYTRVFTATGGLVVRGNPQARTAEMSFTAPATGTYTVLIQNGLFDDGTAGNYILTIAGSSATRTSAVAALAPSRSVAAR